MMRLIGVYVLAVSVYGACEGATAQDDVTEYSARASAAISRNDFDAARLAAVTEVRKACVLEALRRNSSLSSALGEKAAAVAQELQESHDAFLDAIRIENEEIVDGGRRYQIRAVGSVRMGAIRAVLLEKGLLDVFGAIRKPTVMVLVAERFQLRATGTRMTETKLIEMFRERGIDVIDPEQKKVLDLRNRLFAESEGDMQAALQAVTSFNADYLLWGEAAVTSSENLSGTDLKARYANLSLKLVEASSGRVIAVEQATANRKHLDELTGGNWALEEAVTKAGPKLADRFLAALREEFLSGVDVLVDLHGLEYEGQAADAESLFSKMPSAVSVFRKFYHGGVAQFDIRLKGGVGDFVSGLGREDLDGAPVETIERHSRYLRLARAGQREAAVADVQELQRKYLVAKYEQYDYEKLREQDAALAAKIQDALTSQKLTDAQRKQLDQTQKDLDARREEVGRRRKEAEEKQREFEQARAEYAQKQEEIRIAEETHELTEQRRQSLEREIETARIKEYIAQQNAGNAAANAAASGSSFWQAIGTATSAVGLML